ncbi:MAG: pyrroloquinoline quinone biosynthesis protein PqqB [Gemmatimonadales bacterium]|nr:pyrroloquinoline quinone biosynthesis protein PqqB [Gemmatimonadales bacterium]
MILLGTAAGGGYPQWNCWLPVSSAARAGDGRATPRTQSCAAVSADGVHWFLLNASPDIPRQLRRLPAAPAGAARHVPFEGVVLTDAEVDHSLGLVLLREARHLPLWCTPAVHRILREDSGVLRMVEAFAEVPWTPLAAGVAQPLARRDGSPSGLTVEAFGVAADPPRFATRAEPLHTVGLELRDASGARLVYAPGIGDLDEPFLARARGADLVLVDGTFWTDDEMIALGVGTRTARALDHVPMSGPDGSLERLKRIGGTRTVYVHINTTNPALLADSEARRAIEAAGIAVGHDGMEFHLTGSR